MVLGGVACEVFAQGAPPQPIAKDQQVPDMGFYPLLEILIRNIELPQNALGDISDPVRLPPGQSRMPQRQVVMLHQVSDDTALNRNLKDPSPG